MANLLQIQNIFGDDLRQRHLTHITLHLHQVLISGPSNPDLITAVKQRIEILRKVDPQNNQLIPVDLVTASGSGLDPDISPLAAFYQVPRIAKSRGLSEKIIKTLVENNIQYRSFGILGEPRVNVLYLNRALDNLVQK